MNDTMTTAAIEADPTAPIIRITRDFAATSAQLFRAHTGPDLFVRWVGPDGITTTLDRWDASTGGSWRYVAARDGMEVGVNHGCAKLDALLAAGEIAGTVKGAQA